MGYTGVLHYKLADAFSVMVSMIFERENEDFVQTGSGHYGN
jgi:hypothetical protein